MIFAEKGANTEVIVEDAWFSYVDMFDSGVDAMLGQFQVSDLMFPREIRMTFQDFMAYRLANASTTAAIPASVSVHNAWVVLLAVLVALYALHRASPVLIPVMIGVMISYALSPLVNAMEKRHIHRGIGATVLLACLVAGAGSLVFSLGGEAVGVIETLPDAAHKVRQAVRAKLGGGESAIEKMQMAAESYE